MKNYIYKVYEKLIKNFLWFFSWRCLSILSKGLLNSDDSDAGNSDQENSNQEN